MERARQFKLPTQFEEAKMNAEQLKEVGNNLFYGRRYRDAISYYNKAIIKNPTGSLYFTNRALCRLKLQQWQTACADCQRALELEPALVKAHYYQGQALLELGLLDEAVKCLKRAHELSKQQERHYGDEITSVLRLARKRRWNMLEEKRISQELELQTYLTNLILRDKDEQIARLCQHNYATEPTVLSTDEQQQQQQQQQQQLKQQQQQQQQKCNATDDVAGCHPLNAVDKNNDSSTCSATATAAATATGAAVATAAGAAAAAVAVDSATASVTAPISSELEHRLLAIECACDQRVELLNELFAKVDERRRKREVPDYLCGKISFEILRDPVVTPSGITYDRQDLVEHLQRVGHFDPVTRCQLTVGQLIPNLAMKEVVDAFMLENDWAHDY